MKNVLDFIKTTLIGGVLVVLPLVLSFMLLRRFASVISRILGPVKSHLPDTVVTPWLIALVIVVGGCFLVGLALQTSIGRMANRTIERRVFSLLPGYRLLRSLTRRIAGEEEGIVFSTALVEMGGALAPAFIVEELEGNRYAVFVPKVPTPTSGDLRFLPAERVHPIDVPFGKVVNCSSKWGVGSRDLMKAMRQV